MINITHNYENQTVLLTGSNGYVGNEFNSLLEKLNCIIIKSRGDLTLKQTWLGLLDQKVIIDGRGFLDNKIFKNNYFSVGSIKNS